MLLFIFLKNMNIISKSKSGMKKALVYSIVNIYFK